MADHGIEAPPACLEYAAVSRRLAALVVDVPIRVAAGIGVVFLPMRSLVLFEARSLGSTNGAYLWRAMPPGDRAIATMYWAIAALLVPWLYYAIQESSRFQGTLGKRLAGVIVADSSGRRISFLRASARFFASQIPTLGLGYAVALLTARKQALHDLVCGTVVLRGRRT
jgi:uncharacterized RDD family membrane protein YckC